MEGQIQLHGGIGDYTEDWIEAAHQDGRREENRTRGLRNRAIAATSNSKLEWARTMNEDVKDQKIANAPKKRTNRRGCNISPVQ